MRFRRAAAALLCTLGVAGCGATVDGTATPRQTTIEVDLLNTGGYRPEPTDFAPVITSIDDLRVLEARRILGHLVHPFDVDPELSAPPTVALLPTVERPIAAGLLPEEFRAVLSGNGMLTGAYAVRTTGSPRSPKKVIAAILQFPTDDAAARTAVDLERLRTSEAGAHTLPVEGRPEIRAYSRDDVTGSAFLSRGPYTVLVSTAVATPDRAALTRAIVTVVDRQLAAMRELTPTPWDDILDTPFDIDAMMRRALPKSSDYSDPFVDDEDFGVYSAEAALHFEHNPLQVRQAFLDGGVDLVARRAGVVYRARDLQGAFRVQSALVRAGRYDEEIDPPPGLPDARCLRLDTADTNRDYETFCVVVRDRYVGMVVARTPLGKRLSPALYQRAAAQYAILANSE